jgi:hypothetical protein
MRCVIVAKSPIEGGAIQYFAGERFQAEPATGRRPSHRGRRSAPLGEVRPLPPDEVKKRPRDGEVRIRWRSGASERSGHRSNSRSVSNRIVPKLGASRRSQPIIGGHVAGAFS